MPGQKTSLDDLFAKARTEPPTVSEPEVDALLDEADLHGRLVPASDVDVPSVRNLTTRNLTRRIILMTTIAAVLIGSFLAAGSFFDIGGNPEVTPAAKHAPSKESGSSTARVVPTPGNVPLAFTPPGASAAVRQENSSTPRTVRGPIRQAAALPTTAAERIARVMPVEVSAANLHVLNTSEGIISNAPKDGESFNISLDSALVEELNEEVITLLGEYWQGKLNDYKAWIDSRLSVTELQVLNGLRVRAAIVQDEGGDALAFRDMLGIGVSAPNGNKFALGNAEHLEDMDDERISAIRDESEEGEGSISVHMNMNLGAMTDTSSMDAAKMQAMAETLSEADPEMMVGMVKMMVSASDDEHARIFVETWDLADANRDDMEELEDRVFDDVEECFELLHDYLSDFVDEHEAELGAETHAELSSKLDELEMKSDIIEEIRGSIGFIYTPFIEPLLLLYNGSEADNNLISAITAPVAGVNVEVGSALASITPNPASSYVNVEVSLSQPTADATLRLFSTEGKELRREDLGRLDAGSHSFRLNVEEFPSGTYLCHLTTQTDEGNPRVFSKTLQVAR